MTSEDVRSELEKELDREPFVALRLHLTDRRKFEVPFRHVIVFQKSGILLFKGVKKQGSHVAKGYEVLPYDLIDSIKPCSGGAGGRRRKAT